MLGISSFGDLKRKFLYILAPSRRSSERNKKMSIELPVPMRGRIEL